MNDLVGLVYSLFAQFGHGAVFIGVMLDNAGFLLPSVLVLLMLGAYFAILMGVAARMLVMQRVRGRVPGIECACDVCAEK